MIKGAALILVVRLEVLRIRSGIDSPEGGRDTSRAKSLELDVIAER